MFSFILLSTMELPSHIHNRIVRLSRPGIDERRLMGIPPGPLHVPTDLKRRLEELKLPYSAGGFAWCHVGRHLCRRYRPRDPPPVQHVTIFKDTTSGRMVAYCEVRR